MLCPIDQTELVITDRQGVEIDYCPKCRGVWLDRGELDKIIDRSAEFTAGEGQFETPEVGGLKGRVQQLDSRDRDRDYDDDDRNRDRPRRRKSSRRSFLEELFDFD